MVTLIRRFGPFGPATKLIQDFVASGAKSETLKRHGLSKQHTGHDDSILQR